MKEYVNVEDLLKVIRDNAVGRSATFPRGWIRVEDFIEVLKKMRRNHNGNCNGIFFSPDATTGYHVERVSDWSG